MIASDISAIERFLIFRFSKSVLLIQVGMIREDFRMSSTNNEIRACIDMGSSYFRLLTVEGVFSGGATEILSSHEDRRYLGWGEDLLSLDFIPDIRVNDAADALEELVNEASRLGCNTPVLIGTNVIRAAGNAGEIVSRFEERVNLPVSVLSHWGEAALGLAGAASLVEHGSGKDSDSGFKHDPGNDRGIVLVDPGGTSTEVAWGRTGKPGRAAGIEGFTKFLWGTHRVKALAERYRGVAGSGAMMNRQVRRLQRELESRLGYVDERGSFSEPGSIPGPNKEMAKDCGRHVSYLPEWTETSTILFTGGTAVSLAGILGYMARRSPAFVELSEVAIQDLGLAGRRLARLYARGMQYRLPLAKERIDLLIPGLVLVRAIMRCLKINSFQAVTRDLRWGVVLSDGIVPGGYCIDE